MSDDRRNDAEANRHYEDWPVERGDHDEAKYVGVVEGESGGAWFYNDRDDRLFESEVDEENERLLAGGETRDLRAEESLGEAVERLGDELGWESLSEFAREHLERDD